MSHINTVALSGRATRDPEYVEMPSGNNLAKFGIAVERSWIDKNTSERVVKTSFFDVNVWGPFADVIFAKLRKGDAISLTGQLEQETWVDKETNGNRSRVLVNANQVDGDCLFRKADGSDTPEREQSNGQQQLPVPQPPAGVSSPAAQPEPFVPASQSGGDDGIPF